MGEPKRYVYNKSKQLYTNDGLHSLGTCQCECACTSPFEPGCRGMPMADYSSKVTIPWPNPDTEKGKKGNGGVVVRGRTKDRTGLSIMSEDHLSTGSRAGGPVLLKGKSKAEQQRRDETGKRYMTRLEPKS